MTAGDTSELTRRLALLWDPPEPATRGRPARFTLHDVVRAGLAVADADGLGGLSMRRVARELGTSPMSLYTYVPGRTELVDLMVDAAYTELDLPAAEAPWRDGLTLYAVELWGMYQRHPWLLQLNRWRAPLTPHVLDCQEAGLRTLIDTGLSEHQVAETIDLVDNVVAETARGSIAESMDRDSTGVGLDKYWESMSSFWEDWFDVERYPTMTRVWEAGGFDEGVGEFPRALERLLDIVELVILRTTADP